MLSSPPWSVPLDLHGRSMSEAAPCTHHHITVCTQHPREDSKGQNNVDCPANIESYHLVAGVDAGALRGSWGERVPALVIDPADTTFKVRCYHTRSNGKEGGLAVIYHRWTRNGDHEEPSAPARRTHENA